MHPRGFWCCISSVKREFLLTRSHNVFWWNKGNMSIQKCLKLQSVMISSAYLSKCHNKAVMPLLGMKFHQLGKSIGKMIEHDIITRIFIAAINWHVKCRSHQLHFILVSIISFFHITLSKRANVIKCTLRCVSISLAIYTGDSVIIQWSWCGALRLNVIWAVFILGLLGHCVLQLRLCDVTEDYSWYYISSQYMMLWFLVSETTDYVEVMNLELFWFQFV